MLAVNRKVTLSGGIVKRTFHCPKCDRRVQEIDLPTVKPEYRCPAGCWASPSWWNRSSSVSNMPVDAMDYFVRSAYDVGLSHGRNGLPNQPKAIYDRNETLAYNRGYYLGVAQRQRN